jgi:predicted DNA binding CopG/RHH family protein
MANRSRTKEIKIRLTESEYTALMMDVKASGMPREHYVNKLRIETKYGKPSHVIHIIVKCFTCDV